MKPWGVAEGEETFGSTYKSTLNSDLTPTILERLIKHFFFFDLTEPSDVINQLTFDVIELPREITISTYDRSTVSLSEATAFVGHVADDVEERRKKMVEIANHSWYAFEDSDEE